MLSSANPMAASQRLDRVTVWGRGRQGVRLGARINERGCTAHILSCLHSLGDSRQPSEASTVASGDACFWWKRKHGDAGDGVGVTAAKDGGLVPGTRVAEVTCGRDTAHRQRWWQHES